MEDNNVRNRNIDIFRAFALCIVIIYHIWVLTGQMMIKNNILRTFIMLGGEIGVTAFFLISGFGNFFSLKNMERVGNLKFTDYIKRRALRIMPEYYISLLFMLFLSDKAVYLSKKGIIVVGLHLIFAHNIPTVGAINGVLWTMAVTVQFYILAIPIYKLCERLRGFSCVIAIATTVLCKYILLHYVMPAMTWEWASFWCSRQTLPSVIDNFVIGMFVAKLIYEKQDWYNHRKFYILGVIFALILLYFVSCLGLQEGIHTDNVSGYTWHSLVAICIALAIYCFAATGLSYRGLIAKFFLWLAKYEYGIYILHLVLIQSLIAYSPVIEYCNSHFIWVSYVFLFAASITIGYIFSLIVDAFRKEYILKI